ncbi:uncharacterized protein LOC143205910 [Rhynchophorus ferrugineus]|uniref:uncharacterized protein LOC143205909 n=1 Tax=Rhynchophorus ferrugineus TaxID=354439 RepID=UPI003FCEDDFA
MTASEAEQYFSTLKRFLKIQKLKMKLLQVSSLKLDNGLALNTDQQMLFLINQICTAVAVDLDQNNPQKCPYGLYAQQLSWNSAHYGEESEFAKKGGFVLGGATLHCIMTPHGPDKKCFEEASSEALKAYKVAVGTQAFMFESCLGLTVTKWGLEISEKLYSEYYKCWEG